jgi:hypothetical protein
MLVDATAINLCSLDSYLVVLISICSVLVPFFSVSEAGLTEPFSSSSIVLWDLSAAPKS